MYHALNMWCFSFLFAFVLGAHALKDHMNNIHLGTERAHDGNLDTNIVAEKISEALNFIS